MEYLAQALLVIRTFIAIPLYIAIQLYSRTPTPYLKILKKIDTHVKSIHFPIPRNMIHT